MTSDAIRRSSDNKTVEMDVYVNRVLHVLDETIRRIDLIGLLSVLGNSDRVSELPEKLTNTEMAAVSQILDKYDENKLRTPSIDTLNIPDLPPDYENGDYSNQCQGEEGDPQLHRVILMLEKKFADWEIPSNLISSELRLFKKYLKDLRDGMEVKLRETAEEAKKKENMLKACHYQNEQAKKDIAALEEELTKKKTEFNASVIGKNIIINRYQEKVKALERGAKEAVENREKALKEELSEMEKEHKLTMDELRAKLFATQINYDNLLKEHLAIETKLRAQKIKVENQLAAMIQKFDEDMAEKQIEEEQCQQLLNDEKKNLEKIQALIDEFADDYDELMQEKALEEQEILEQKLFLFVLNRSARRIQRAFLAYKLKMLSKKKGKGKKSSKKNPKY